MFVVFANAHDETAKTLVRRWEDRGAMLMTPRDLSCAGWCCISSDLNHSLCTIGGVKYPSSEISGVLMRSPSVLTSDLPHIQATDRSYVAAEMNAFLVYWLNTLACPILNRPTPQSLCGPGWYPEHWIHHAWRAGMQVRPVERSVKPGDGPQSGWPRHDGPYVDLTIVGQYGFSDASHDLMRKARRLAETARVEFVHFRFDRATADAVFLQADLLPSLDDPTVEQAVLACFETGNRRAARPGR